MSEPEQSEQVVYSLLMKADYLIGNSQVFPVLVRAASAYHGVPYGEGVLSFAATRPKILDALKMTEATALDQVLRDFGTKPDTATVMDQLILTAVQQYKENQNAND